MQVFFPNDLKTAIISPLYKTGSKTECSNYRPISVLSTVAKIFEKLISVQLYEYLENNAILASQQSVFRKKFSTETAMLDVTNKWLINMDRGYLNGVIFLDLKKAFDCVDHEILLKKSILYGCNGLTIDWFRSYLTNCTQMCKIAQTVSSRLLLLVEFLRDLTWVHYFFLFMKMIFLTVYLSRTQVCLPMIQI